MDRKNPIALGACFIAMKRLISSGMLLAVLACITGCVGTQGYASRRHAALIETHQEIRKILESPKSASWKLKALEPYIRLGDKIEYVNNKLGKDYDLDEHGPGFFTATYHHPPWSELVLDFYPDGVLYSIAYIALDEKETASRGYLCHVVTRLGGLHEVSWPRGKDEEEYLLHHQRAGAGE